MRKKANQEKGITLLMLTIIIIVITILVGITAYSISQAVNSSKLTAFATELRTMQGEVNNLNLKMKGDEEIYVDKTRYKGEEIKNIGEEINTESDTQAAEALNTAGVAKEEQPKYKYFNKDLIKSLGVEGVEQELLINIEKREIVSYKGIEYKGQKYYTLNSLPNVEGLYNVEHEDFTGKPTFDVEVKQTESEGKWEVKITNIQYTGYIEKWEVKYKQAESEEEWKSTEKQTIELDKKGTYKIKIANENIESEEKEITATYKVMPVLYEGMEAIMYDENKEVPTEEPNNESTQNSENKTETENQKYEVSVSNPKENTDWYSYVENEDEDMKDGGTTNGGKSKWANAKYKDNYFVWIPRYAYKENESITYTDKEGNTTKGVDLKFIETRITNENVETEVGEGYTVPKAFSKNGEVAGIWVGKYGVTEVIENTEQIGEEEHEAVAILTKSTYGRSGTAIPKEETTPEETPTPSPSPEAQIQYADGTTNSATATPESESEENIEEKLKTTTGNRYGIYNFKEGFRIYIKNPENNQNE